jgi:hypothetical protein
VCRAEGGICRANTFFQPVDRCFLYKAKYLLASPRRVVLLLLVVGVGVQLFVFLLIPTEG